MVRKAIEENWDSTMMPTKAWRGLFEEITYNEIQGWLIMFK